MATLVEIVMLLLALPPLGVLAYLAVMNQICFWSLASRGLLCSRETLEQIRKSGHPLPWH